MFGITSLVVVAAAAMFAPISCYPNGAPAKDCWTERPLHGANMPAWEPSPYEIKLTKVDAKYDENTYTPGEYIKVTIRSRDGQTPFKGYLLKVYSSNGVSAGTWGAHRGVNHVLKRCGVTHNKNNTITETDLVWKAPNIPIMDTIQFKAIVVKDYDTFYNNILSRPLKKDYPPEYLDELFKRLRAYARMTFNVTVPSESVPSLAQPGKAPPAVPTSDPPNTAPVLAPASDLPSAASAASVGQTSDQSPGLAAAAVVPAPARGAASSDAAAPPNVPT